MSNKTNESKSIEEKSKRELKKSLYGFLILVGLIFGIYGIMCLSLGVTSPMMVVQSGSMEPTLNIGDIIFVKAVDDYETEVMPQSDEVNAEHEGTIIIFKASWSMDKETPTVHRVIYREFNETTGEYFFMTKGDNVGMHDAGYIYQDDIIGIYVGKVPYVGYPIVWLSGNNFLVPIIIVLWVFFIGSFVYDYYHPEKKEKNDSVNQKEDKSDKIS